MTALAVVHPNPGLPPPPDGPARASFRLAGSALSILSLALLGFALQLTVFGALAHDRAQKIQFSDFRAALAQATAPVSHLGPDGKPLAPGTALAVISIPAIDLREVIDEGTSSGVLAQGPGHRRDTVLPGQAGGSVVLGRRAAFGGPFARLAELRGGDRISVVTGQGEHTFVVKDVRRAGEPQPAPPGPDAGRLTLVTADGPAYLPTDVLRVDADLITPVQDTPALAIRTATLPPAEEAMGTDPIALVPLILWAQLLVAVAIGAVWIRHRVGRWHAWLIGLPVLILIGALAADQGARLLPNLL